MKQNLNHTHKSTNVELLFGAFDGTWVNVRVPPGAAFPLRLSMLKSNIYHVYVYVPLDERYHFDRIEYLI